MSEDDLVREALARNPGRHRTEFLDAACAGNAELRAAVESRLTQATCSPAASPHVGPGSRTVAQPAESFPSDDGSRLRPGAVIAGRYTTVKLIGAGGMGEVWVAQQSEPVKRQVALKLIKAGMDSRAVMQRFEAERQALAVMDHPNIAHVLDGGLTDDRRPFFVMELVDGVPLNRFCDDARLGIRERLQLFIPICQAIQHAHHKGIVHRDLKPANILVAVVDGRPTPKAIDFGLAKATQGRLTDESLYTEVGAVIGTLEYMSPEQADGASADVDTRADIYSLGVILYEMLTGLRPFDAKSFKRAALHEMVRTIREVEPIKPSSRISTEASLPSLASVRRTEPAQLTRLLRGDLDWVAMKCLEKQRERRYETASGLARDIERYLADEPVEATPPSAAYRLQKFVRRNKGPVLAASLIALALVAGMIGTTIGLFRANRAAEAERLAQQSAEQRRQEAETEREKAVKAAENERRAREQAQRRLLQIEKGNEVLTSIFDDLDIRKIKQDNEPLEAVLSKRLVKAAHQLEGESVGDPLMVAALQHKLGHSLVELGFYVEAIPLFEKAKQTQQAKLGADHIETINSLNKLAVTHRVAGKLETAIPLLEEALKLTRAKLGTGDPATLRSMFELAAGYRAAGKTEQAIQLLEKTIELQTAQQGADHLDSLTSMNDLANAYRASGQTGKAITLLEKLVNLQTAKAGFDHSDTLTGMNNLALAYLAAGQLDRAVPLLEETLRIRRIKHGADHPHTLTVLNNLALGHDSAGKLDEAIRLWEETLTGRKARLGADHPETLLTLNNLASAYQDVGKLDQSVALLSDGLQVTRAKLGAEHPHTQSIMNSLASAYLAKAQPGLALPLLEETLRIRKSKLAPGHVETVSSMNNLAKGYQSAGKLDLAGPLFEEALKLARASLGPDHPTTLLVVSNLAGFYDSAGKIALALPLHKEAALGIEKRKFQHQQVARIVSRTINALEDARQFDEAEAWRRKWLATVKEKTGPDSTALADELTGLGLNLLKQDKWSDAESNLRKALAIRDAKQPDLWQNFNTKSILGSALLGQKKFADAEPLLLAGFQGMKSRQEKIPRAEKARVVEAAERLVQLYGALGKNDEATKWQAEMESAKKTVAPPATKP